MKKQVIIALAVVLCSFAFGTVEGLALRGRVRLLQGNVPQDEKFSMAHVPQTLAWVAHALGQAQGQLVVAPETAMPLLPSQLAQIDPHYWDAVKATYAVPGRALLIGLPRQRGAPSGRTG